MLARLGLTVLHLSVHKVIEVDRGEFTTVSHLFIIVFQYLVGFTLATRLVLVEDLHFLSRTRKNLNVARRRSDLVDPVVERRG